MTIVLDNCVPRRYLRLLREWDYETVLSTTHIPADAPDLDVIALAQKLDGVLLTVDLDFANILNYPPGDYGGIIVLRYQLEDEAELDITLKITLHDLYRDNLKAVLVVVSPGRYRIRS